MKIILFVVIMNIQTIVYICNPKLLEQVAGVVELVDTLDLGSSAARCESSSLSACTVKKLLFFEKLFLLSRFCSF